MVVEDDALVGMGLVCALEELGARVFWSTGIEDALEQIDTVDRIDLAIVDLNLHGGISTPVLDRLQAQGVAIIISTGYDTANIDARFQSLPYTEKPFTRAKMCGLMAQHLKPRAIPL